MEHLKKDNSVPCPLEGRVKFLFFSFSCLAALQIVLTIFFIIFYGKMNTLQAKFTDMDKVVEFVDQGDVRQKDSVMMSEDGDLLFGGMSMGSEFQNSRKKRHVGEGSGDADDWMWMSSSARVPTKAIKSYCQEAKTYCAASGPPGLPGLEGSKGDKGDDGIAVSLKTLAASELQALRGPPGQDGLPGLPGMAGLKGEKGEDGSTSSVDMKKVSRLRALRGPPGPAGLPGARGEKGDKGDDGSAVSLKTLGASELEALRGPTGLPGLPGPVGLPGQRGLPGAPGPKGNVGYPGLMGFAGQKGALGIQGISGTKGENGRDGLPGPVGQPGRLGFEGLKRERGLPGVCSVQCQESTETTPTVLVTTPQKPSDQDTKKETPTSEELDLDYK